MSFRYLKTFVWSAFILMNIAISPLLHAKNLSHEPQAPSFQIAKQALIDNIQFRGDLPTVTVEKQLDLLGQLAGFEFGQFLIQHGGLNGYWTHYLVTHPVNGRVANLDREGNPFTPLETFLLNSAPTSLATQQRFGIFKNQIQKRLCENCVFASIPSGLMTELLDLDYSTVNAFALHGIDLDPQTLAQARDFATKKNLLNHCYFSEQHAWSLDADAQFDLIASNGLTIYEPDHQKVIDLYTQFYKALKSNGTLITSFLTPPPSAPKETGWKLDKINLQDAFLQKVLFVDILNVKFQAFRTEETVKEQLQKAGFQEIEFLYDEACIFPTVIATKGIK